MTTTSKTTFFTPLELLEEDILNKFKLESNTEILEEIMDTIKFLKKVEKNHIMMAYGAGAIHATMNKVVSNEDYFNETFNVRS